MSRVVISYGGVSIQTSSVVVREVEHESIDSKTLDIESLALRDGGKLLGVTFKPRRIRIRGEISGTTQADLETNIDTLKQTLNESGKNLDISYAGGTRRYIADMAGVTMVRRHFHITFAEFEAEFIVASSPFGRPLDTSTAEYPTLTSVSTYAAAFTATGTYKPNPKIIITFTEASDAVTRVRVRNVTTGDSITVDNNSGYANNDQIIIDTDQYTVTLNGVAWDYSGIFPQFVRGGNDLRISFSGIHFKATIKIVYYPNYL